MAPRRLPLRDCTRRQRLQRSRTWAPLAVQYREPGRSPAARRRSPHPLLRRPLKRRPRARHRLWMRRLWACHPHDATTRRAAAAPLPPQPVQRCSAARPSPGGPQRPAVRGPAQKRIGVHAAVAARSQQQLLRCRHGRLPRPVPPRRAALSAAAPCLSQRRRGTARWQTPHCRRARRPCRASAVRESLARRPPPRRPPPRRSSSDLRSHRMPRALVRSHRMPRALVRGRSPRAPGSAARVAAPHGAPSAQPSGRRRPFAAAPEAAAALPTARASSGRAAARAPAPLPTRRRRRPRRAACQSLRRRRRPPLPEASFRAPLAGAQKRRPSPREPAWRAGRGQPRASGPARAHPSRSP
eukprot:582823-Prymnesium_polylepis.1